MDKSRDSWAGSPHFLQNFFNFPDTSISPRCKTAQSYCRSCPTKVLSNRGDWDSLLGGLGRRPKFFSFKHNISLKSHSLSLKPTQISPFIPMFNMKIMFLIISVEEKHSEPVFLTLQAEIHTLGTCSISVPWLWVLPGTQLALEVVILTANIY